MGRHTLQSQNMRSKDSVLLVSSKRHFLHVCVLLWVSKLTSGLLQFNVLTTAVMSGILLWMSEGPLYLKSGPGFGHHNYLILDNFYLHACALVPNTLNKNSDLLSFFRDFRRIKSLIFLMH